tara:strand:- start:125 stop:910 length:786 start_codon:yes stop_codon:yes gene_type:complete
MLPYQVIRIIIKHVFNDDIIEIRKCMLNKEWKQIRNECLEELKERIMNCGYMDMYWSGGYMDMNCLFRYYANRFLMCNDEINIYYLRKHPSNIRVFVQSCIPWICYTKNQEITYPYEGLDYESGRNRFYLFAKMIKMIFSRERRDGSHSKFLFECNIILMELLEILYLHIKRNMKSFRNAFNMRILITFLQDIYGMYMIRSKPYIISENVDIKYIYEWSVSVSQCSDSDRANRIYKEWPLGLMRELAELEAQLLSSDNMVE